MFEVRYKTFGEVIKAIQGMPAETKIILEEYVADKMKADKLHGVESNYQLVQDSHYFKGIHKVADSFRTSLTYLLNGYKIVLSSLKFTSANTYEVLDGTKELVGNKTYETDVEAQSIISIKLPETVDTIGFGFFAYCNHLQEINLENVKVFDRGAFMNCKSLKTIILGSKASTAGAHVKLECEVFMDCSNLETVNLNGPVDVSFNCFALCSALKNIDFKYIHPYGGLGAGSAFSDCVSIEEADLSYWTERDIKADVSYFFSGCTSLKTVKWSEKLVFGDMTMFEGCTNLHDIYGLRQPE